MANPTGINQYTRGGGAKKTKVATGLRAQGDALYRKAGQMKSSRGWGLSTKGIQLQARALRLYDMADKQKR